MKSAQAMQRKRHGGRKWCSNEMGATRVRAKDCAKNGAKNGERWRKESAREDGSVKEGGGNVECREISWGDKSARFSRVVRTRGSPERDVCETEKRKAAT